MRDAPEKCRPQALGLTDCPMDNLILDVSSAEPLRASKDLKALAFLHQQCHTFAVLRRSGFIVRVDEFR